VLVPFTSKREKKKEIARGLVSPPARITKPVAFVCMHAKTYFKRTEKKTLNPDTPMH
jgi:hypothetical protein